MSIILLEIESTFFNCLDVKKLLAQSNREICKLIDCNGNETHNKFDRKQTLNHLTKLALLLRAPMRIKWLWIRVLLQSFEIFYFGK